MRSTPLAGLSSVTSNSQGLPHTLALSTEGREVFTSTRGNHSLSAVLDPPTFSSQQEAAPASASSQSTTGGWGRSGGRVFLKSDEEKAQLVRLCISNFGEFMHGREKFWPKISSLYQRLHPEGVAPNVKGYMQRYTIQRKREVEEARGKSGIAESATEWQQSMDHWLELVRDFEEQLKEEKNTMTTQAAARKKELVSLRESMTKSFLRKREAPTSEAAGAGREAELDDNENDILAESPPPGDRDSDTTTFPNKKQRSSGPEQGASGGDRVFSSQRRTTDRILKTLREGDQEMLRQMREMELEKIDRWKEILGSTADSMGNKALGDRIEQLERQGQETKETLTNIVSILQSLQQKLG